MKANITIEPVGSEYALYINGNYAGTFCKTVLNIKLGAWHLPEIEI